MSVQLPCSLRTEIVRSPWRDRSSYVPVRGLCTATYDMSTGYGLTIFFFKFVKLLAKPNRRGRGARESVLKSYSRLLPPQGGLEEATWKGEYGQDTGSVDPSQAKCELGITLSYFGKRKQVTYMYHVNLSYWCVCIITAKRYVRHHYIPLMSVEMIDTFCFFTRNVTFVTCFLLPK